MSYFLEAWDAGTVVLAIFGGTLFGAALQSVHNRTALVRPFYRSALQSLYLIIAGLCFWPGQILEALQAGDQHIDRITSRFGLWILFSLAASVGSYVSAKPRKEAS